MPQLDPEQYRKVRGPALRKAGLTDPVVDYLLDLERLDPPAAATTLAELAFAPKWEGKRAVLAGTNRVVEYRGGCWRLSVA